MVMPPLVLLLIVLIRIKGGEAVNCGTYTASDGSEYDLSSLTKPQAEGYSISLGSYAYYFNLCDVYWSPTTSTYCFEPAAAYQIVSDNICYLVGTLPAVISDGINGPASGVSVRYVNENERCLMGTLPRIMNIHVKCDRKAEKETVLSLSEPSTCVYDVIMTSPAACPKEDPKSITKGLSPGSIFLIILLVLVVVYLAGGMVFRYKFQDIEPGLDLIPNRPFWASIPGLVKDGCVFTYEKIKGRSNL